MFKWFKSVSQLKELGGNVKNNIKFNTSREKKDDKNKIAQNLTINK
jgi:hypothetical protein